ncbi:hypothetical protein GCM10010424_71090 [Streptomyces lienomycini]
MEMEEQPLADEGQPGLCLELVSGVGEDSVQLVDATAQQSISVDRTVDRGPCQSFRKDTSVEVEDALAESRRFDRLPVVGDARRQQNDRARIGGLVPTAIDGEVDGTVVKDHQVPGVMGMERVGVISEVGVEDLGDPCDRWPPGADPRSGLVGSHARNVQDKGRSTAAG